MGVLLLGSVLSSVLECSLELSPENWVCLLDVVVVGRVDTVNEVLFLGINPIVNKGASDVGESSEDTVKGDCHGGVGSIVEFVAVEFGPKGVGL